MEEGVEDEWNPGWYAAFVETLVLLPRVLDLQLPVVSPLVEDLHMRNEVTQTGFKEESTVSTNPEYAFHFTA